MSKCCKCCRKVDVCNKEICGRPEFLSIYAPVIYDEIGVNVCRTVRIPDWFLDENPGAETIRADVIDVSLYHRYKEEGAKEEEEKGNHKSETTVFTTSKPNCCKVTLRNIKVSFDVKLYDGCGNFLDSTIITADYLSDDKHDRECKCKESKTNPSHITLEMYVPYGVGTKGEHHKKFINVVGMSEHNNQVVNGLNIAGVGKAMNFDRDEGTFMAGVSFILRTVYFEAYKINYEGKTIPPKADSEEDDERICERFVESGLLSREIKPLELEPPKCERKLKEETKCERDDCTIPIANLCGDEELFKLKCECKKDEK